ncbi:nuclear transport factor 2 family protein [Paludibacterium sp.]|uniref:nuclear transport factor 2 family protein n=1 Tax=Paludibacterium sp. TaxID=1917523 RepID=UPI0025EA65FA|nr:nuclear transport factor 2 family protein [Paludibacterium sp.]MBV8647727.1 nuclear transport factor 2 family protein [Paludibacterium sp.]
MARQINGAVKVARAYFEAMANKDVAGVLALAAEQVTCDSPAGSLSGVQAYRGFHEGFARMLEKLTLQALFGDEERAVIVYRADTLPVKGGYVTEHLTVRAGKIVADQFIYDAAPYAAYLAALPQR